MTERLKFFSTRDWAASRFLEIEAKFGKIEAKILDISDMASRAENGLRVKSYEDGGHDNRVRRHSLVCLTYVTYACF